MNAIYKYNTIVVGTGAAGYNAADCLFDLGVSEIAIVTEGIHMGTSRNAGSDKQTYYKLALSGEESDSVGQLADVLFSGECVDGDHALCEAALSAQCFYKLVQLSVPFPKNRYGEYIGYKTDHDPNKRATSAGPYTSKYMTEKLEDRVIQKGVRVFDQMLVVKIITSCNEARGLLCLDLEASRKGQPRYVVYLCRNIIYATGGPGAIYADNVYPLGHHGSTGIALEAGILAKNVTEWQYGMASLQPKWNVSGTYMQVMPRFVSTDQERGDEREFLLDYFSSREEMLSLIFLKGYQWPFDVRKIKGSSLIDILVYIETCIKGRRVFLDYQQNMQGEEIDYLSLSEEAREYLLRAGACHGTPYERLYHMNTPAVEYYQRHGVDLSSEYLEIAICAQHNNGGLGVDEWWQTSLKGFFAVGEVAGTHGVYRPGGSALNAGQVGAVRAAQYIAQLRGGVPEDYLDHEIAAQINQAVKLGEAAYQPEHMENVRARLREVTTAMSRAGAIVRDRKEITKALQLVTEFLTDFEEKVSIDTVSRMEQVYYLYDVLLCQKVYLSAMLDYMEHGGNSRGSALYLQGGLNQSMKELIHGKLILTENHKLKKQVQEMRYQCNTCQATWRNVRDIPKEDEFFENIWAVYRENNGVY